jgi:flagellar L-ring protein precursor FlgH
MMNKAIRLLITILLLAAYALPAGADSLFTPDTNSDPYLVGLYSKHPTKVKRGDILRVHVSEQSLADVAVGTDTDHKADAEMKLENSGILKKLLNPFYKLLGNGDIKYSQSDKYKADDSTNRSAKFEATVTVVVLDVMENGNVVIEGRKELKVNRETEYLVVSGEVNPKDISPDLLIESEAIANAHIEYVGEGQLSKRQSPGFISRIIQAII